MNTGSELSLLTEVLVGILLVLGAAITLIGTLGLLRLRSFYERVHAPTLGTTLGTACVALASIVYFSASTDRLALHDLLIVVFIIVTTPISLIVLVSAAVQRDAFENASDTDKTAENERH